MTDEEFRATVAALVEQWRDEVIDLTAETCPSSGQPLHAMETAAA